MFFAVSVVEEACYKVAILRDGFVAYGAFPFEPRFHLGIAVGAAHYDAQLMWYFHGAVNPAVEVNSLG